MIDLKIIKNDIEELKRQFTLRNTSIDVEELIKLYEDVKSIQSKKESLQCERNTISKQIDKNRNIDTINNLISKSVDINGQLEKCKRQEHIISMKLNSILYRIPNLLNDTVPYGINEDNNIEIYRYGVPNKSNIDHVTIGSKQIDIEQATKMSGSRFSILYGNIAKLHRCLIQFMLDVHTQQHEYTEVYVPYIVNDTTLFGTGQLPKFQNDLYKLEDNQYLIPTAEVPVTNLVKDKIIKIKDLPLKYVCHTPCFRKEAGSYSKDIKGIFRQHQFEKVELVQICTPEQSILAHEELTQHAENILKLLELPYRKMLLCSGDTGFSSAKTYDLEVWIPSYNSYKEISSCSNCTDFQARRMNAKYKNPITKKNEYVHTINGSGLAVGRTLIAILENYQNDDGSVTIPGVLIPYMKTNKILNYA